MSLKRTFTSLTGSLVAALLLGGCVSDNSDPDPDVEPRPSMAATEDVETDEPDDEKPTDEYADCAKGEIESDIATSLPLAGPGVDPDTGELSPGNYLVATTYLALQPDKMETAIELSGPTIEHVFTLPGFVGVTIAGSAACNSLRTITIWESEEAMFAFVASPAHTRAMAQTSVVSRGTSNTITWDGDEKSVTWQEAARQLGQEEDGDI